ncbi:MAG: hypothetical protein ACFFCK_10695, partial [Promethearchaeota archaeon]
QGNEIRKHFVAAAMATPIIGFLVSLVVTLVPMAPWSYYPTPIEFTTTWVLVVLVLLPIFTREGSFLQAANPNRNVVSNQAAPSVSIKVLPSRGVVMGWIIGSIALLGPFFGYHSSWYFMRDNRTATTLLSSSLIGAQYSWIDLDMIYSRLNIYAMSLPLTSMFSLNLMLMPLMVGFNLLFGHSVLRYLQARASKKPVLTFGVLGAVVPFVVFASPYFVLENPQLEASHFYIPLPIVQVVGLLMILYAKRMLQDNGTRNEIDERTLPGQEKEKRVETPSSAPHIEIPLLYRLISRFRNPSGKRTRSVPTKDQGETEWI